MKYFLLVLLFLISSILFSFTFIITSQVAFAANLGISKSFGIPIGFFLPFALTYLSLIWANNKYWPWIIRTISLVPIIITIVNIAITSTSFTMKVLPLYLSWGLAIYAGYNIAKKRSIILPVIFALFPLVFGFGFYDKWAYKWDFGTWSGELKGEPVALFEFKTKEDRSITNETLKGKVVLFDFWFIGCLPCWKKFPELERIYNKYKDNPDFELYAVNRNDDAEVLFKKIEGNGYTFPVLRGTSEDLEKIGISWYPSVMVLNRKGEAVFLGELSDAEAKLIQLLN